MIGRKYIWFSFFQVFAAVVLAQKSPLAKGDYHFSRLEYKAAVEAYKEALNTGDDFLVHLKLAHSYVKLNRPEEIELWYKKAYESRPLISEDKFNLAISLTKNKKYDEAIYWFEVYSQEKPGDKRALSYLKSLNNLKSFYLDSKQFKISNLPINSSQADFSPTYYRNGIIFVSGRKQSVLSENLHLWDQTPFLDLYYWEFGKNSVINFSKNLNTSVHEGPSAFYQNEKYLLFTRNSYSKGKVNEGKDGIVKLKIYQAVRAGDKWGKIKKLPFNHNDYSVGHPTITSDGNRLYFVSDMPGGFGGTDLYFSDKLENDSWSEPVNLGEKINTAGNEMFPFIHRDKTLYFASNGLGGLGGLDIFEAHIGANHEILWVKNMGSPLNSNGDDFGLILDHDRSSGFFTSDRQGGKGHDDIYNVQLLKKNIVIEGIVVDKQSGERLPNVRLKVLEERIENNYLLSNHEGYFEFSIEPERSYRLILKKLQYLTRKDSISTRNIKPGQVIKIEVVMEKADFIVNAKTIKKNSHLPISESVKLTLLNKTSGNIDSLASDPEGEIELSLQPNSDYLLRAEKENYFTLTERFSTHGLKDPKTFEFEFPMQEIVLEKPIKIENIYYDYDKWYIRQDALPELDKIFQLLIDNPQIKVELSSHTDSRGEAGYNLELSQKRAESVVNYLVSRGIVHERLIAKGYGESSLLNYCGGFVECDESDHQINRRTEFKVIGKLPGKKIRDL